MKKAGRPAVSKAPGGKTEAAAPGPTPKAPAKTSNATATTTTPTTTTLDKVHSQHIAMPEKHSQLNIPDLDRC